MPVKVTVIGAGGIGSHLVGALAPAIHRGNLAEGLGGVVIRILDSDRVSEGNLAHQRFLPSHVGEHKVIALAETISGFDNHLLRIEPVPMDVTKDSDIDESDLVVVAVDSHRARRVAQGCMERWLDLRCMGDGFIAIDDRVNGTQVSSLTQEQPSLSCQIEGSIESGNIQFGFMLAAAHGAQWVVQSLREISGERGNIRPLPQSASISFGTLGRMELTEELVG